METSVTLKKNLTWSNWRFVTKIFGNKYDFLRESPSSLFTIFSFFVFSLFSVLNVKNWNWNWNNQKKIAIPVFIKELGKYIKPENNFNKCQHRKLIVIPGVWRKSMLRVYGCVFWSISLLSVYMCVRIPLSSRSIAGASSSRALPGFPSNYLCAFLMDGCVATKQPKYGNLGDIEEKSNLIKLKVCEKDFMKQIWFPPRVPILSFHYSQFFCLVTIFSVESKELELELEQPKQTRHPCIYQRTWKIHKAWEQIQ